jgi:hypothetical protein
MKVFESLNKRQKGDVDELIDLVKSYLILWGYKPTFKQLEHIKEMISIIIKSK